MQAYFDRCEISSVSLTLGSGFVASFWVALEIKRLAVHII